MWSVIYADEVARGERAVDEMVSIAQAMGGTCTGEHGIGYGKLKHLLNEHDAGPLRMVHSIKQALDPKNIMNPGKLGSHPRIFGVSP